MNAVYILAFICLQFVHGRRQLPPIYAEETSRKSNKAAECQLGGEVKELGSTWFADLGPPFGIMYCLKCQCVAMNKKRRIVGKVICRNIKHECPKPTCDEPVLYPGRCCKMCPEDIYNPELAFDVPPPQPPDEEDTNFKYYANIMVGEETATGRFSFLRKNLYYSFYSSSRPKIIQFLNTNGNILEEQELGIGSLYQNQTDKICGVWRRIPRDYRRLIREEKLVIGFVWPNGVTITGQLYRYRTLATEMFSSLLVGGSNKMGGTAIISVSTSNPSIHIMATFTGLFDKDDGKDTPVSVLLSTHDNNPVIEEVVRLDKASPELNTIEISSAVSSTELRLLARNKLILKLKSKNNEINGLVKPRAVCEIFQCLLSSKESKQQSSGLAWLYLDKHGKTNFRVKIDRVNRPAIVGLVVERKSVELEDFSPELTVNGWANGTLDPLSPKYLEMLYSGELGINVESQNSKSVIKGRLTGKYVAPPIDTKAPLLLTNEEISDNGLSALAWIDVDSECNMYYEVEVSKPGEYSLFLSQMPIWAFNAPITYKLLSKGNNRIDGSLLNLLPGELSNLANGVAFLELQDTSGKKLLRAQWTEIEVPEACLPQISDNELHYNADDGSDKDLTGPCYHGDKFHEDGAQWRSATERCTVCHCSAGKLSCEPLVCPNLSHCHNVVKPNENQCCPQCNKTVAESEKYEQKPKGCHMAGQFFPPGSTWHPYLPPNGFDTCTICTCQLTLKLSCERKNCPKLKCDEKVAIRTDKRSCCKVCPSSLTPLSDSPWDKRRIPMNENMMKDEVSDAIKEEEIIANGGCKYPVGGPYHNGQEWHPRIYSHGEMKCVNCSCKDGKVKCERKRCSRANCNDECCATQCKRRRRNIRRHH